MNFVAVIHLIASFLVIAAAVPLIRGRVKMNAWYGIRIREAFESEERWRAINRYGGRLFLIWGLAFAAFAVVGLTLSRNSWATYNVAALGPLVGGLILIVVLVCRHARKKA